MIARNPHTGEQLGMPTTLGPVPTVRLADVISAVPALLPAPPLLRSWAAGIALPAFGNDKAGDCVEATYFYTDDLYAKLFGVPFPGTEAQALALYKQLSGWDGVIGSASDKGTNPADFIAYAMSTGLPYGGKLDATASVSVINGHELRTAINAGGCVIVDANLPVNLATTGPWDIPPNPSSDDLPSTLSTRNHMFALTGFDAKTLSSAKGVAMTNEWVATCVRNAWLFLRRSMFNARGLSVSGVPTSTIYAGFGLPRPVWAAA